MHNVDLEQFSKDSYIDPQLLLENKEFFLNKFGPEFFIKKASNIHYLSDLQIPLIRFGFENGARNYQDFFYHDNGKLQNLKYHYTPEVIKYIVDNFTDDKSIYALIFKEMLRKTYNSDENTEDTKKSLTYLVDKGLDIRKLFYQPCEVNGNHKSCSQSIPLFDFDLLKYACELGMHPNNLITLTLAFPNNADHLNIIEYALNNGANLKELTDAEIDLDFVPYHISKLLIENGFNPYYLLDQALSYENSLEALQLAVSYGVKIPTYMIMEILYADEKIDAFQYIIENSNNKFLNTNFFWSEMDAELEQLNPEYSSYIKKDVSKEANLLQIFDNEFLASNGTIVHILAKAGKNILLKWLLENKQVDLNLLNSKGQTPLFFATNKETVDLLIAHGVNRELQDNEGKLWLSNPSLELINYLIEKGYLDADYAVNILQDHTLKGNYEHASKIFAATGKIHSHHIIKEITDAINNGLDNSVEINKYHAIVNLMHKAGIEIPTKYMHLVNNTNDNIAKEEFAFLRGSLHKLAEHYVMLAKVNLIKRIANDCDNPQVKNVIDNAFSFKNNNRLSDFTIAKNICFNSTELIQIEDEYDAYQKVVGGALNILDNDFSIEVLTINGIAPMPLSEDIVVYRGLKANLDSNDFNSWFKYGIRAFSAANNQKFLGYYVDQPWNDGAGRWEYGGTYVSLEPKTSASFAAGITTQINADSVLLEIKLPQGYPKICGSWLREYELVPSTIAGNNIVGAYKIEKILESSNNTFSYKILEVIKNPYSNSVTLRYNAGDNIEEDQQAITKYHQLGCRDLPVDEKNNYSLLYKDYNDFIINYTTELHLKDQDQLFKNYFYGRPFANSTVSFSGESIDCDPAVECC